MLHHPGLPLRAPRLTLVVPALLVGIACGAPQDEDASARDRVAPSEGEGEGSNAGEGEGEATSVGEGEGEGPSVGEGEGEGTSVGEGEGEGEGSAPGPSECGAPVALTCTSGTLTLDTASGSTGIDAYSCASPGVTGFAYTDRELLFAFTNPRGAHVQVSASTTGSSSATFQLFDLGVGGDPCAAGRPCVDVRDRFGGALEFDVGAGETRWLSYDKRDNGLDGETTPLSLVVTCQEVVCGNGVVDAGEQCDDGDTQGLDGCSATCAVEPGFTCAEAPSVCTALVCGDGRVEGTEACDDGDTQGLDGCSASCTVETGFTCVGTPSNCVQGTGETCNEALSIGAQVSTSYDTSGRTNDVDAFGGSCGFFSASGPEVFYAVDVGAGQLMTARFAQEFNGALLALVTSCSDVVGSCFAGSPDDVSFANHGATPRTVYVAVDGLLGSTNFAGQPRTPDQGAFTLTTTSRALSTSASAEVCETATTLVPGTPVQGSTVGHPGTANGFAGTGCNGFGTGINGGGRDAFYRVTVPAGKRLRAAVTGAAGGNGDVVVGIVSDCTATRTSCLAAQDGPSGMASETAQFLNSGTAARDVFVVVDSVRADNGFSFTLTATLE